MRCFVRFAAVLTFTVSGLACGAAAEAMRDSSVDPGGAGKSTPPAPLGIFASDALASGKMTISLSTNFIRQSTSRIGMRLVSPGYIAASTPWFWDPTKPVRLVPLSVLVWTRTATIRYGVTDALTAVFSFGTVQKDLDAITFTGASGTIPRGESATGTRGVSDFEVSAIYRIYRDDTHRFLITIGTTLPTGSNRTRFTLLQPDGGYATSRAFYAMQPGTGTYDLLAGATYAGVSDRFSWGVAWRIRAPFGANPERYRWGALHEFHGWVGYTPIPVLTTTFRVAGAARGPIRGFDREIRGRAQSANPNFYGGQRVELFAGATIGGSFVGYDNASLSIEAGAPLHQNLNGPAISRNWNVSAALAFKI
jgi:hypothetical protein